MKEEDIIRYEINGQVYLLSKDLFDQEQKFIESQQKAMADYIFGGVSKYTGQHVFDIEKLEARLKEIQGDAVEYIAQQHGMSLAREYDWIGGAIKLIGIEDYKPYAPTKSRSGDANMDALKHRLWNSKVDHMLAIEVSKFHGRYEDEKDAIDAKFKEEQEAITAQMVAHKLTNGDDQSVLDQYSKTGILMKDMPGGINKFGILRKK